ncbi:MAG: alpha/beta hydrolase [Patescibacteria group bacterium]|nr:alpha/beta hydrolase [Patescibacteria group bacterium]
MKNALLLHGTNGNPEENWLPWLKKELEQQGWTVVIPSLPHPEKPSIKRYNEYLLNTTLNLGPESYIIGHSSGAVAALGLLQALPKDIVIDTCILVGAFKDDLGWDALHELFDPQLDFEKIKKHAKKFVLIHADNDPYCPLDQAKYLAHKLHGDLIIKPGEKHFSTSTAGEKYKTFPFLLELIFQQ